MSDCGLTECDREAFAFDGVICLRQAFGLCWLSLLASGLHRDLQDPGPNLSIFQDEHAKGRSLSSLCSWPSIPEFHEFLFGSPVAKIAAFLLGAPAVHLVEEQWFIKEPLATNRTSWHQDQPFYDIDLPLCSVWVPLSPVPREGALEFVRGSHRSGILYIPEHLGSQAHGEPLVPDIEQARDRFEIVSWALEPGDCIVFDGRTLHGGGANPTPVPARRFSSRWVAQGARYLGRSAPWSGLPRPPGRPWLSRSPGALLDRRSFPLLGAP